MKIKAFPRAHSVKKTVKGFGLNGCVALIKPHISKLIGKKERRKVCLLESTKIGLWSFGKKFDV